MKQPEVLEQGDPTLALRQSLVAGERSLRNFFANEKLVTDSKVKDKLFRTNRKREQPEKSPTPRALPSRKKTVNYETSLVGHTRTADNSQETPLEVGDMTLAVLDENSSEEGFRVPSPEDGDSEQEAIEEESDDRRRHESNSMLAQAS